LPIKVVRLPHGADLELPAYGTPGAAGMDDEALGREDRPHHVGITGREPLHGGHLEGCDEFTASSTGAAVGF
jgi:hypothetical protein